jgi:hypothetical protein
MLATGGRQMEKSSLFSDWPLMGNAGKGPPSNDLEWVWHEVPFPLSSQVRKRGCMASA